MTEQPHSKFQHVYAVVRVDLPVSPESPENSIAVVKVFSAKIQADEERMRLGQANEDKGCRYHVQITRLVS